MYERIKELAERLSGETVELRRHFHSNPEVSWCEVATTERIREELERMGADILRVGFGEPNTGLVAEITGGRPGRRVALRADIDALPLQEENDVPYRSLNAGVMHACGHDAHIAMLLSAARVIKEISPELSGSVRFLFQPAEEHGRVCGADVMVKDGVLDGVDAVFGMHIESDTQSGVVGYRVGPFMAAADGWSITVTGRGGHGAEPERAVDPTPAAFEIGSALNAIISRELSPRDTAVLSVCGIRTPSFVFNIIPERVEMCGTVRTFEKPVQSAIESAMRRIADSIAAAHRCGAEFFYNHGVPATVNEPETTALAVDTARSLFGEGCVREVPLVMGAEDFSYFANVVPAAYVTLGSQRDEATAYPHHSPKHNLDESVLWRGAALHAAFAYRFLSGR